MTQDTAFDDYIARLRDSIGTVYRNEWSPGLFGPDFPRPLEAFTTQFSHDAIRKYVDAVGDLNPLYRDPEYAAASPLGVLTAPPTMMFGVGYGMYPAPKDAPPSNDFTFLYAGDEYEWYDVIREGDEVDITTISPTDVQFKQTRTEGAVVFVYGEHEFRRRSDGELVGRAKFWNVSRPGRLTRVDDGYMPEYTKEDIARLYAAQDAERSLGAERRYWEDVEIGAELAPVARGPHTVSETVAWVLACAGERFFFSSRMYRFISEHAGWGEWEPRWNVMVHHHEGTLSRTGRGFGSQRSAWAAMMVTNWMGDHGFLKRLRSEHRGQGHYGNVYWTRGVVAAKRIEDGEHVVDVDLEVLTQDGSRVLRGFATVVLPTRTADVELPLGA